MIPDVCKECVVRITCDRICESFVLEEYAAKEPNNHIPSIFERYVSRVGGLCKNCGRSNFMTFLKWRFIGTICRTCGFGAYIHDSELKFRGNYQIRTVHFDWKYPGGYNAKDAISLQGMYR